MSAVRPSAWSCFTKGPSLDEALNYDDAIGQRYEYDSHVVNHNRVAVGDILVLRDADLIYGYGVVDAVRTWDAVKVMQRCPACSSSKVARRSRAVPPFRCNACGREFVAPLEVPKDVTAYSASYEQWWFPFDSPAPVRALTSVYAGRDRQNAIRRLDVERTTELLTFHGDLESALHLQLREAGSRITGGRVDAVVQRRVGQQQFRKRLLDRYGNVCAVTGRQPEEVLDAAHLFTFAERPEHLETAGLLLRADVHRLFDRMLLSVEPRSWRSRVAPGLVERYPTLGGLDSRPLEIGVRARPDASYLEQHWVSSVERWKRLSRRS